MNSVDKDTMLSRSWILWRPNTIFQSKSVWSLCRLSRYYQDQLVLEPDFDRVVMSGNDKFLHITKKVFGVGLHAVTNA